MDGEGEDSKEVGREEPGPEDEGRGCHQGQRADALIASTCGLAGRAAQVLLGEGGQVGKGLGRASGALGAAQRHLRIGSPGSQSGGIFGTGGGGRGRREWGSLECTVG